MGEWRGLAVDENGDLWHAGKWSAGLITWDAVAKDWYGRNGLAYKHAFGDPYGGPGTPNPPVFQVPKEGHDVYLSAVAVCPDGKVWFSTLGAEGVAESVASFQEGHGFQYYLASAVGLPDPSVKDLVCLPDGRLAVASATSGLVLWNPATGAHTAIRASGGLIRDDAVQALEVDRMPSPPTLHVSTATGAAAIRVPPP
jgi:WD40 repeat protein